MHAPPEKEAKTVCREAAGEGCQYFVYIIIQCTASVCLCWSERLWPNAWHASVHCRGDTALAKLPEGLLATVPKGFLIGDAVRDGQ